MGGPALVHHLHVQRQRLLERGRERYHPVLASLALGDTDPAGVEVHVVEPDGDELALGGPSVSLVRLLTHELFTHIVGPAPGVSPGRGANLSGGPSPPGRPPTESAGLCASGFVVVAGARPSLTSRATKRLNLHLGDRRQALVPKRGAM